MTVDSAFWIAAVRARESERPDRLFADPFARELAGRRGFAVMDASERASGGENRFIPVRVRWFDDLTVAAIAAGLRQVVLLGAGLDTRAYRLDMPGDVDWYELDRREVLTGKETVLAGSASRGRRHAVAGDVAGDWLVPLLDAGFNRGRQTLWLAEGLFFYLTESMIVEMLRGAARVSGTGSLLAADVIGRAGLDGPAMRPYRQWCDRNDAPPPFGSDDPAGLLVAGGWQLGRVTAPGAPDANYDRLPTQPDGVIAGRTHLVVGRLPAGN